MSTYGPVEPVSPAGVSAQPSRTTTPKVNGWYKTCIAALNLYGGYIILILGRISMGTTTIEPVNRQFNAIVLTALSLIAILTFLLGWRLDTRARDQAREAREAVRDAQHAAWQQAVLSAIADLKTSRHGDDSSGYVSTASDGPTLPLLYRPAAATGAASVIADQVADRIMKHVDGRIDERLDDIEQLVSNDRRMKGHNGRAVAPFPPRART